MEKKSIYTKKLGRLVANGTVMSQDKKRYHVMAGLTHNWIVVPDGTQKTVRSFFDLDEAVYFAKQMAAKKNGDVIIHNETGGLKSVISFAS